MYIQPSTLQPVNIMSTDNDAATHETSPELRKLLSGVRSEYIVTHPGISQYNSASGGVSACGLAALNCARLVLGLHAAGIDTSLLLEELAKRPFLEDVLRPCLTWSNSTHLAVDDIYKAPVFQKSLTTLGCEYGQASRSFLRKLIKRVSDTTQERGVSACVVITRPPEIIACFCIADAGSSPLFVIFDSHPRPDKHPQGAAFIFHRSITSTTQYLSELLRYDADLLRELGVQWEAQLLSQCSGDFFVASDSIVTGDMWAETALQASLQAVGIQARVRELELENKEVTNEKKRLAQEVRALQYDLLRMDDALQKAKAMAERYRIEVSSRSYAQRESSRYNAPEHPDDESSSSQPDSTYSSYFSPGNLFSWRMVGGNGRSQKQSNASSSKQQASRESEKQLHGRDDNHQNSPDDLAVALQMQLKFNKEDKELGEQFQELQRIQPMFFDCGICLEKFQEDHVAVVRPCEHACCRECLASYAASKIAEHRYPILCPQCTANREGNAPGEIDDDAIQNLGLTDKQYEIFVEMQMLKFSIMINCRK
ncbi:hypothetical protein BN946_scf184908.g119 [Trametes cinnabarina]|uniref:RING-type domain-containing protein n=1 Tax=Pycnoporus cinnabarinus TaxID=5643 RepID=A0A060SAY3_PYCCI|nr:hypothetical protein BN946_scf184908.g119 [Trametes cinnabarina]